MYIVCFNALIDMTTSNFSLILGASKCYFNNIIPHIRRQGAFGGMPFKARSKRLRKNLRQLKRKKIEGERYVKDFFIDNDLAFITCNVTKYSDIIDPFSSKGYEWPNERFIRFVESNAEYIPVEYPIVLEINGRTFSDKEKDVIRETIHDYYALKMGDAQLAIGANRWKAVMLIIVGCILAIGVDMISRITSRLPLREAVIMLFWLFLWEGIDCIILDGRRLREAKTNSAQMANITVTFKDEPEITEFSDVVSDEDDRE